LQFLLPAGFYWNSSGKIEKDPDQRVQQAMELVFSKMLELGRGTPGTPLKVATPL
jgi:hypothetical protein